MIKKTKREQVAERRSAIIALCAEKTTTEMICGALGIDAKQARKELHFMVCSGHIKRLERKSNVRFYIATGLEYVPPPPRVISAKTKKFSAGTPEPDGYKRFIVPQSEWIGKRDFGKENSVFALGAA